ncbi:hypothetical protein [Nesterenkonia populi]|uniref:hypothetical protein n=1 Tax=Nesterenkonia populi TaxID=1591087 RepID=UPI0011BFE45D|nr:hypothetical protein [Nesterenkonia populi]
MEIDGRTVTLEAEEVNEGDVGALELETVVRDAVGNEIRSQYDGDRALPGMPAVTEDFGVPHSVEVVHPDSGETVLEQETSPEFRGFAESHPECLDGTCSLELMEAQEDGGLGLVSAERGRDWTERVESFDDYATTDGLVCVYGGELLQLSECRALAHDYNAEHQNAGTVNVDPESGEWSGDYNSPSSSGLAEADRQAEADRDFEEARERESEAMNEDAEDRQDEAMNAQQGQPGQLEGPQAFTNPLGAHLPQQGTATGTSPAWAQPTTMEAPGAAPDPEGERGCEWGEISWNPVSWVLVPVQCALAWAFVPSSASTEVSVGQGLSSWNNNIIGSTIGLGFGIDGVLTPFNRDAGGCSMSLDLDFGLASVPIGLDFCDGWGERLRELTRLASVLIASVFSFCETRRRLASMVNYNAGQC